MTEITRKLCFSRDHGKHVDESLPVGGTQGIPRLDERVLSPRRICIDSVFWTHFVIVVLLPDTYTLIWRDRPWCRSFTISLDSLRVCRNFLS